MALASKGEDAPDMVLDAGLLEDGDFRPIDGRGVCHHLIEVVHDAVGAVLREDDEVEAWQAALETLDIVGDLLAVLEYACLIVKPWHLPVDDCDTDGVHARRDIPMVHGGLLPKRCSMKSLPAGPLPACRNHLLLACTECNQCAAWRLRDGKNGVSGIGSFGQIGLSETLGPYHIYLAVPEDEAQALQTL